MSYRDGSIVNPDSMIEVVGGKGTDGLAHAFQMDAAGKLWVNISGIVTGAISAAMGDTIVAYDGTDAIYSGSTALTPSFANIQTSTSGPSQVVAAVASKRIRVTALAVVTSAATNIKFQSHVTPTDISGLFYCALNGGIVLPHNPVGWFQTIAGEALDINLSAANATGGCLTYVTV